MLITANHTYVISKFNKPAQSKDKGLVYFFTAFSDAKQRLPDASKDTEHIK